MNSNELSHYGVKGMKWGVRKDRKSGSKKSSRKSKDYVEARALRKKNLSQLSNKELRTLNQRLQLEQQYKQLTTPQNKNKGKSFVAGVHGQIRQHAINSVSKDIIAFGSAFATSMLGLYMGYRRSGGFSGASAARYATSALQQIRG